MIIECISCSKKFNVDSSLIPLEGRNIQCGSCNHIWFFKKENQKEILIAKNEVITKKTKIIKNIDKKSSISKPLNKKSVSTTKKDKIEQTIKQKSLSKSIFSLGNFFSFIIVLIISFAALIIILDTFKTPLYAIAPELETIMFNLFETIIDIKLFIKDLV